MKLGHHPISRKSAPGSNRGARSVRQDKGQIKLALGIEVKRRAYDLAKAHRCSIGRLVEDLIAACVE